MTRQQAFDTVVRGLAAQKWAQSFLPNDTATCAYRGSNGRRCAAGHLIPDDQYKPKMESNDISYVIHMYPGVLPRITDATGEYWFEILEDMQSAHDQATSPYYVYRAMRDVADKHKLVWPADVPLLDENMDELP